MPRSCQFICIRAAFVTGTGMQVGQPRQVVRPRLLNDWAELLKQFPACSQTGDRAIKTIRSARSHGGGFFMIGRCLLAQVTMKHLLACSQMGELKIGLQPGRGALSN